MIITLCGSTKFKNTFINANKELTLLGHIVLSVGCFGHSDKDGKRIMKKKIMLDTIHKSKILMSDCIFVLNVNGYIGESTQSEILFAKANNKKIFYSSDSLFSEVEK